MPRSGCRISSLLAEKHDPSRLFGSWRPALSVAVLVCVATAPAEAQREATWQGGNGDWTDVSKWDTGFFPNNGNDGVLWDATFRADFPNSDDTLTIDRDIELETFTFSASFGEVTSGATINGPGNLTVDTFNWPVGTMSGSGTTKVSEDGSLRIRPGFGLTRTLSRTLINNGTGRLNIGDGDVSPLGLTNGVFINNGRFEMRGSIGGSDENGRIVNNGTFVARDSSRIFAEFQNSGTVTVEEGVVEFRGENAESKHTGSFNLSPDAGMVVGGRFLDTSSISGNGTLYTQAGQASIFDPGSRIDVNTVEVQGTTSFNSDFETNILRVNGHASIDTPVTVDEIDLSIGTLDVFNSVSAKSFTWGGGNVSGPGSVAVSSNGSLSLGATNGLKKSLASRLVNNGEGSFTRSVDQPLRFEGGTFVNRGSLKLRSQQDGAALLEGKGENKVVNFGTFTKKAESSVSIQPSFANAGHVVIEDGNLTFERGMTQRAGALRLGGGNVKASAPLTIENGSVAGRGNIGATLRMSGRLEPGERVGRLAVDELTLQPEAETVIEIAGAGQADGSDTVDVAGAATLDGQLTVDLIKGFENDVSDEDTFTILTAGDSLAGAFANSGDGGRVGIARSAKSFRINHGDGEEFPDNSVVLSDAGIVPGDMNGDGNANNLDINRFVEALTADEPIRFEVEFGYAPGVVGDMNGDGEFNNLDINPFVELLTGASSLRSVPEPSSVALLGLGGLLLSGRRTRARD